MSNIANTIQYLRGGENRFITIVNQETNERVGKATIYLSDIPNEDLEHYIKFNLGPITKPTRVWIEMRSKVGTNSKKEHHCYVEIQPLNVPKMQEVHPTYNPEPLQATPFLGNPGTGNVFGLGLAEVIGMQVKAEKLSHKEEQLAELKEEYKELKHKYNNLDTEHRGLLSKLSIAEAQKEMAVMLAKSENKSIFESAAFEKLMDKAPELIGGIAAMKSGGAATVAALGSPSASEVHAEFIEYINDNLNENQINFLGSICHLMNNQMFMSNLNQLIKQFATNNG